MLVKRQTLLSKFAFYKRNMKLLLTYPPFCTPATPPYSITNIGGFLKKNTNEEIILLDLNEAFHNLKFPKEKIFFFVIIPFCPYLLRLKQFY